MSAVIDFATAKLDHIERARNRAKSKARAFGYCRVSSIVMGNQVADLVRAGVAEDVAIRSIVKSKSAPHFDPPTRPAA